MEAGKVLFGDDITRILSILDIYPVSDKWHRLIPPRLSTSMRLSRKSMPKSQLDCWLKPITLDTSIAEDFTSETSGCSCKWMSPARCSICRRCSACQERRTV